MYTDSIWISHINIHKQIFATVDILNVFKLYDLSTVKIHTNQKVTKSVRCCENKVQNVSIKCTFVEYIFYFVLFID